MWKYFPKASTLRKFLKQEYFFPTEISYNNFFAIYSNIRKLGETLHVKQEKEVEQRIFLLCQNYRLTGYIYIYM